VVSSPISECQGRGGHFIAPSLTFVVVLLVIFVAYVDDVNSYALFVGLFLHIVPYGIVM